MEKDNNSNTNEKHQFSILRFRWVVKSVLNFKKNLKIYKNIYVFCLLTYPKRDIFVNFIPVPSTGIRYFCWYNLQRK